MSKPTTSHEERQLVAIMFTDMVGYTALAQKNEARAVELLEEHRAILRPVFQKYKGRVVDTVGDAFFVEFASAVDSINCAVEIQTLLKELNSKRFDDQKIQLRIGIHLGDVIHKEDKVIGDAVNIASRIEPQADPGGICVTQQVFDNVRNKVEFSLVPFGIRELKNVELPVNLYTVALPWEGVELAGSPDNRDFSEAQTSDTEEREIENPGFKSGIESLDEILGGGYPGRSTVLVIGPPGIGKEALSYWFTHFGLTQNDFCVYLTNQSSREILQDVRAYGVDFSKRIPFWFSGEGGEIRLNLKDLATLFFNVQEMLKKNGKRRIRLATDILSSLLMLNSSDLIYKFLAQLFGELKRYDFTLIATLEEGMHPPNVLAAMQQLFDGVIELKLYEEGLRVMPLLRIKKMRGILPRQDYYNFFLTKSGMEIRVFDE